MTVTYNTFEIDTPITSISYNDDYGYYVAASNVKEIINNYVKAEEYDHIFIGYKLGENLHKEKIRTGDWIGLGGMVYDNDIGYSNIRVPNENSVLLYKYSSNNKFPEEVFVHEFLHGLERIDEEYGNKVISLHSNEEYGYKEDEIIGLKNWYKDYMQKKVASGTEGLSRNVYSRKPLHTKDFLDTIDLTEEYFKEPENLIEEIQVIIDDIKKYFNINKNTEYNDYLEESNGSIRI